jgi:hypothetical protein
LKRCWKVTVCMRNEEVFQRVKEKRNILQTTKNGMLRGLVTSCVGTLF